jgi:hypothetical protein
MKKEPIVSFVLKKIKTEQFAILEENFKENIDVKLNSQIQFRVNSTEKLVGSFVSFNFLQRKNPFIKIEISCHFKIEDNSWNSLINSNKNEINLPKGFLMHLAIFSVGTARGVLFAKTESTTFNEFIIPTINLAELIKEDAVFPIK